MMLIAAATKIHDLKIPPGNHLERLRGDLAGLWSIHINKQWRIVFRWENGIASEVTLTDYH
jgi:proteic killer suppression protein